MPEEPKRFWANGGLTAWLFQKGVYVALLAGALWIQLNFVSKNSFDKDNEAELKQQVELNKTLLEIALSLKEITKDRAYDRKQIDDLELRLRAFEQRR